MPNYNNFNAETKAIYHIWRNMMNRVEGRSSHPHDVYYIGMEVEKEWEHCFINFALWAVKQPTWQIGKTIDRIDNNKGYLKENCRFATRKEQNNNRQNNIVIVICGIDKTLAEWCEFLGLNYSTVRRRIFRDNWPVLPALLVYNPNQGRPTWRGRYCPKLNAYAVRKLDELGIKVHGSNDFAGFSAMRKDGKYLLTGVQIIRRAELKNIRGLE